MGEIPLDTRRVLSALGAVALQIPAGMLPSQTGSNSKKMLMIMKECQRIVNKHTNTSEMNALALYSTSFNNDATDGWLGARLHAFYFDDVNRCSMSHILHNPIKKYFSHVENSKYFFIL